MPFERNFKKNLLRCLTEGERGWETGKFNHFYISPKIQYMPILTKFWLFTPHSAHLTFDKLFFSVVIMYLNFAWSTKKNHYKHILRKVDKGPTGKELKKNDIMMCLGPSWKILI